MDLGHAVLSGLLIALGATVFGKYLSGKELNTRMDKLESTTTPLHFCRQKHQALEQLLEEKFANLGERIDALRASIDRLNRK